MTLRNPKPINWRPTGCSDAIDGSESFEGAMSKLQDLVPSQRTNKNWVCRPAATAIAAISAGHPIVATYTVGDMLYGFVSDGTGHDLAFAYNLGTNTLLPLTLANAGSLITSQPTTGDWTPPTFAQVGPRVVVTHPGFVNTTFNSGNAASWIATAANGNNVLLGGLTPASPGDGLYGTHIAPGTTVVTITNGVIGSAGCSGAAASNQFTVLGGLLGNIPLPGYAVQGAGISGIITDSSAYPVVTYSATNPSTFTNQRLTWSGSTITMSLNAIGSSGVNGETISSASVFPDPTGASRKFGYFDISSASIQLPATTFNGSQNIAMANVFGLQPGMAVSGPFIPVGTFIRYMRSSTLFKPGTPPSFGDLVLFIIIHDDPGNLPIPGQVISGPGITPGTQVQSPPTILGYAGGDYTVAVPLSFPASGGASGAVNPIYTFGGLVSVFLSASAGANQVATLTFTGGTPANPLFAIVDTAFNPLPSLPLAVTLSQFGAAIFACGINGMPYSDSLQPIQRSFANQALVPGDGLAITALGSLPLSSPITGGVIQAVIAFAGVSRMYQITGAPQLGTLSLQAMNVATGTLAPLSITPTNFGLAFISPEGMRIVGFDGTISDPIGDAGLDQGISFVFISTINPSRIAGAANADTIRFSVINNTNPASPTFQEWCFDITRKRWYGPMSSSYLAIDPWRNTFVGVLRVASDTLANGSLLPTPTSSYIEFGTLLSYVAQTVLLPDNPDEEAFGVNESSVWVASSPSNPVQFTVLDENSVTLDVVSLNASVIPRQRLIPQDKQWVFRQMALRVAGASDQFVTIGRINLRYQELGYPLPSP